MRKIVSILTFVIAFVVASAGVWAVFSAQAANQGNKISAGTLKIQVDTDSTLPGIQSGAIFDLSDLKPGVVTTKQVTVFNIGSLPLTYNSSIILSTGDDILFGTLQLMIGITSGGSELYNGTMGSFGGFTGGARILNSGVSENLYFTVSLPEDADETLEGKSISVNFNFNAAQVP